MVAGKNAILGSPQMMILLQKIQSAEYGPLKIGPGYILFVQQTEQENVQPESAGWSAQKAVRKIGNARLWLGKENKTWSKNIVETNGNIIVVGQRYQELVEELVKIIRRENVFVFDGGLSPTFYINDGPFSMLIE